MNNKILHVKYQIWGTGILQDLVRVNSFRTAIGDKGKDNYEPDVKKGLSPR